MHDFVQFCVQLQRQTWATAAADLRLDWPKRQDPGKLRKHVLQLVMSTQGRKKTRLREIQNTQKHCNLKTKLQKKNIHAGKLTCPVKRDYFNRKYSFQPLIFRGHVSFSGVYIRNMLPTLGKGKTFCQPNCTSSLI